MDESDHTVFNGAFIRKVARYVLPWLALVVVLFVAAGMLAEYRDARRGDAGAASGASQDTTASADATSSTEPSGVPESEPADGGTASGGTVVVLIEGLNMRVQATTNAEVLKRLPLDTRLTLIGESPGWYNVRDAAGDEGWVAAGGKYSRLE